MIFADFKNARIVRSGWLDEGGRRLDCNPYMSGALEARDTLKQLKVRKDALSTLTAGHAGGIYNGPMFRRNYVESPEYGVPFISSGSMLQADLTNLPLLRREDAESSRLSYLQLQAGMTLISCSGTIGRMTYVRPEMSGMWSSQDVMKVVPNTEKVAPGYLYAFLSSRFGVPLVVSGTYGAIIQHIEPEHIAALPVPRFGDALESQVDSLIKAAADDISESSRLTQLATHTLLSALGLSELRDDIWHRDYSALGWGDRSVSSESLRALNYDPRVARIRERIQSGEYSLLGTLCDPSQFKGKIIFTRIDADPEHGYMLLGQRTAFHLRPEGRWIARKSVAGLGLIVPPGTTLIPSHGTLGEFELYCRAVIVTKRTAQYAYSGDFFRCVPIEGAIEPGYLFAFMRSRLAFRMLRSISSGGKQQEQHPAMMYRLPIPRLGGGQEREIAALVDRACKLYDRGLEAEEQARTLVEKNILSGGV
ncbi:MAG: restriction endonuclease subunit S [Ralstonia sp.]|uniref:Restriction endonuclease subunit S n=1 Tax=Ralstonia pickettii TaxID=329 RepID=A0A9Q2CBR0_RALPI|nr:restriction endonuclease subunit S [Ralstonia pickettii]MBA9847966.1 restriction endonuclease subunit S [Ralstonia pickettii]MBA9853477.1 restriction endonuclease subunit S [Ralstonia pickettii]MBA9879597.1 restriction endonuclease subunit S [Ralstonia pickettii]MBA9884526.1 restriction endonuclease subunit S [Ralstonia pickettii]MBA9889583.1 restriction endonuclease subunit S [Ralstonia pickettii]